MFSPLGVGGWRRGPRDDRPGPGGRHRGRRRRLLRLVLAGPPRLERRRPRRACPADERVDLPLRRSRRPAALLAQPDEDDDELGRALPRPGRGGGARDRLAGGGLAPPRLLEGTDGGAGAPSRLGRDLRAAPSPRVRRGGPEAVPPHVGRGGARSRLLDDRRLPRPEPAHDGPGQRCPPARCHDPHRHAGDRHRGDRRAGARRRDRQGPHRVRGRGRRRRHLRPRDRAPGRRARPGRADGAPVRHHQAVRPPPGHADPARPFLAGLFPRRERRPRGRGLRAGPGGVGPRRHPARFQQPSSRAGLGALRPAL